MRFDAYCFTPKAHPMEVAEILHGTVGEGPIERAEGVQGYGVRMLIRGSSGHVAATVKAGGVHDWPHVDCQGEASPEVAEVARAAWPDHSVTRVDSAEDFEEPGCFERIVRVARQVAERHRVAIPLAGDWVNCEKGRTQYLGSPQSSGRGRIYEKGHEQYYARGAQSLRVHWTRVEVQQRPRRERRLIAAKLSPEEVWGMSGWSRDLYTEISGLKVPTIAAPSRRALTLDSAMHAMMTQWGRRFAELRDREGSACAAGEYLEKVRAEIAALKP